jgi:hypothetical protein
MDRVTVMFIAALIQPVRIDWPWSGQAVVCRRRDGVRLKGGRMLSMRSLSIIGVTLIGFVAV